MVLENIFFLQWHPALAISFVSLVITLLITIVYKYTTDQKKMKRLKEDLKNYQKKMKELRDDPKKMMDVQKKAMGLNLEYMKHSFKSTIYTILPVLILFAWLNAHLAYYPITPNTPFDVSATFKGGTTGNITLNVTDSTGLTLINDAAQQIKEGVANWTLKGNEGEYQLLFEYKGQTFKKTIVITTLKKYDTPKEKIDNPELKEIIVGNEPVKPLKGIPVIGGLSWIWLYILSAIVFSTVLRKVMKVY